MSAPIVYKWDDPGAPAWVANANGVGAYEVLHRCLVTGYGNKPGAGWSVVYDEFATSGNYSITNGPQTGVFGLYHSRESGVKGYEPIMYVAEAMTAADTAINGRSYQTDISQTGFSYSYNIAAHGMGYKGSGGSYSPRWIVVANDRWCWFVMPQSTSCHAFYNANPPLHRTDAWSGCPVIGFGAINSPLAAMGAGDNAVFGNFHLVGGKGMLDLIYPSSVLRGVLPWSGLRDDTGQFPDRHYCLIRPFSSSDRCPEVQYESQLIQAVLYSYGSSSASYQHGGRQLGRLPGLFGWRDLYDIQSNAAWANNHPGGVTWQDEITLDGRRFVYGPSGFKPLFVSLEAADW